MLMARKASGIELTYERHRPEQWQLFNIFMKKKFKEYYE